MVNWAKPDVNSTKTTLPGEVQTGLDHAIKMDFTSDTNIPTGAIRYNTGKVAFESYSGSAWVRAFPAAGTISQGLFSSAPSGHLLLRGGTIGSASSGATILASANAEDLFTNLWNNSTNTELPVSSGRGASAAADFAANKTITLPDFRGRVGLGVAASGTGSTRAGTGGAIDHVHTIAHTHDLQNHTHTVANHTHTVYGHYHTVNGSGADITLSTSSSTTGSHTHTFLPKYGNNTNHAHNSNPGTVSEAQTSTIGDSGASVTTSSDGNHAHAVTANAGNFGGRIGNVSSAVDGDTGQPTTSSGAGSTGSPSTNITGAVSASNSGTNNQAFLAVDYIIKL